MQIICTMMQHRIKPCKIICNLDSTNFDDKGLRMKLKIISKWYLVCQKAVTRADYVKAKLVLVYVYMYT